MNPLSTAELELMRQHQVASLFDQCQRLRFEPGLSTKTGKPVRRWFDDWVSACGFEQGAREEVQGEAETVFTDAKLRLPIDVEIDRRDRIKMLKRHGEDVETYQMFEIVGEPRRGPSGLIVDLALVTDGTE